MYKTEYSPDCCLECTFCTTIICILLWDTLLDVAFFYWSNWTNRNSSSVNMGCAICLADELDNEAFILQCYHSFCLECIQSWLKHGTTCPLCKRNIEGLVYNIENDTNFQLLVITNTDTKLMIPQHPKRTQIYALNLHVVENKKVHNQIVNSATYKQKRIGEWIERDLQTILKSFHTDMLTQFALSVLSKRFETNVDVCKELREFLGDSTEKFVEEFDYFSRSKLSLDMYDRTVQYVPNTEK
jgi:hypothetical protein